MLKTKFASPYTVQQHSLRSAIGCTALKSSNWKLLFNVERAILNLEQYESDPACSAADPRSCS